MGLTVSYNHRVKGGNLRPLTLKEVELGIERIRKVVKDRGGEFKITSLTDTSIMVQTRSDRRVETFKFCPVLVKTPDLYIVPFTSCKTNGNPEHEGICEMARALQQVLEEKLYFSIPSN